MSGHRDSPLYIQFCCTRSLYISTLYQLPADGPTCQIFFYPRRRPLSLVLLPCSPRRHAAPSPAPSRRRAAPSCSLLLPPSLWTARRGRPRGAAAELAAARRGRPRGAAAELAAARLSPGGGPPPASLAGAPLPGAPAIPRSSSVRGQSRRHSSSTLPCRGVQPPSIHPPRPTPPLSPPSIELGGPASRRPWPSAALKLRRRLDPGAPPPRCSLRRPDPGAPPLLGEAWQRPMARQGAAASAGGHGGAASASPGGHGGVEQAPRGSSAPSSRAGKGARAMELTAAPWTSARWSRGPAPGAGSVRGPHRRAPPHCFFPRGAPLLVGSSSTRTHAAVAGPLGGLDGSGRHRLLPPPSGRGGGARAPPVAAGLELVRGWSRGGGARARTAESREQSAALAVAAQTALLPPPPLFSLLPPSSPAWGHGGPRGETAATSAHGARRPRRSAAAASARGGHGATAGGGPPPPRRRVADGRYRARFGAREPRPQR